MLHLDPDNLKRSRWKPALFESLDEQPKPEDILIDNWQAIAKAQKYHNGFKMTSALPPALRNATEEAECLYRADNRCVATGKSSPRVF